ncbi:phosphoserine phosphatase SerB [Sphingomonas astaxanthinifaciens]|uniref:Phosphoserine phosphatase n=1 Tax=Sphingomonas astaxanthinifaciens DSM 22298 TaxID=1123267 RepID=A0ABQ5Z5Y4_9SPHN|nr:phosphoserine phosphatase SerB [Sphingomonas astaxanthinifaciens]GLR46917.1 phosphoserine phosphatase SerB [Sphingomonas astaxanthinifaciens DSM 22298]
MFIATLIAAGRLGDDDLARAVETAGGGELRWIDPGDAADLLLGPVDDWRSLRDRLETALPGIDVILQPVEDREKRLLVADMDSTMIGQECIDELADFAGKKAEIAAITERAMQGELDFAEALHQRVAALNGLGVGCIDRCRIERVTHNEGARTLVQTMRRRGAATLLVTGGFHDFADPLGAELGFEEVRANYLESIHGHLTGRVTGAIVDAAAKRQALIERRDEKGIPRGAVLAVGDGANDGPMIDEAGLGVSYRGKPKLEASADARLRHNDLTALLWAQGIPKAEWATD